MKHKFFDATTGKIGEVELTDEEWAAMQPPAETTQIVDLSQITAMWEQLPLDVQAMFAPYRDPFVKALERGNYAVARRMVELQAPNLPVAALPVAQQILAMIPTPVA